MGEWENVNETTLPEKEELYSKLNRKILKIQITCMQKDFVKTLK